ncbi:cell division protein FtsA [Weissella confusa]|uniref:Cell division protein FtsA n=1 Tax=Weissella fermenti TaxID=2987699 RepID=A0ABT6D3Z0_9LACO|nr:MULTISPECIES: cell division protein FtsA [Weissella]MBJ7688129.1 cell division protein FtsA [Weissella confusa]MCW0926215.1 cell division protein FtsA [Weissella sp. LMG 11983]MDF9300232.1 cell division protein FtsA [Weissella sp. BK2]
MANHGLIVGLDVGTNTIKVLAADVRDQQANIVAVGRSIAHGVKRGVVVDIEATANDIRQAVAQINEQTSTPVTEVVASLPASNIQIQNVSGTVTVKDSQHISYEDVSAAVKEAVKVNVPNDREIVELLPTEFIVDDFDGIQDPNDMVGMRLEMKAVAYTAPRNVMGNLRLAIAKAGLQLRDFVLTPLAYSKTILDDGQQEFGTIILDMGAGHTTATVVHDHQLKFLSTFPAGSDNISRDISAVLEVGLHDADMLKLDSGLALSSMAREDNKLVIKKVSSEETEQISEVLLAQIIEARLMQILDKLGEKLQLVGAFELPGGIVVTGGGAALRGTTEAIRSVYNVQVKPFSPTDIGLRHPGYAGAWALVHYAAQQSPIQLIVKEALYGLPLTVVGQPTIAVAAPVQKPTTNRRPARPESQAVVEPSVNDTDDVNYDEEEKPKKKGALLNFFKEFFD